MLHWSLNLIGQNTVSVLERLIKTPLMKPFVLGERSHWLPPRGFQRARLGVWNPLADITADAGKRLEFPKQNPKGKEYEIPRPLA